MGETVRVEETVLTNTMVRQGTTYRVTPAMILLKVRTRIYRLCRITFTRYFQNTKHVRVVDGDDPRFSFDALGTDYCPWVNPTEVLLPVWALAHRPSRHSLQMLFDLVRYADTKG